MVDVPFFPATYSRSDESLPSVRLVNMIYEKTPQGPFPSVLLMRPSLEVTHTPGNGAIRAAFKMNGVLSGDTLCISGNGFFDIGSNLGTISTASGRCEIDASETDVVVCDATSGNLYVWTGTTFDLITGLPFVDATSVAYYQGRWYYAQKDTSIFWWSAIGDPTTVDPLAFATTETSADKILRIVTQEDDLVFFGSNSTEFWYGTGDPNGPVARYTNRTFSRGLLTAEALAKADNTIMFVGDDCIPYRVEGVPTPLINPQTGAGYGVVEKIRDLEISGSIVLYMWPLTFDGHAYVGLNISGTSYLFDITTGSWLEWDINVTHCVGSGDPHLGGPSGVFYTLNPSTQADEGLGDYSRIAAAFVPVDDQVVRCDEIALVTKASGEASISMRYLDTVAAGWSDWSSTTTVNRIAQWRRLGRMQGPGRYFEFSCSDEKWVNYCGLKLNPRRI